MVSIYAFIFLFLFQISPGDLSKYHREIEGINNCLKCHSVGQKTVNEKCLSCHSAIKNLILEGHGFHFRVRDKFCSDCHKEHYGRDFKIVNFDENNFDHREAGFNLEGKHAKIKCLDCHSGKFIKVADLRGKKTFLGLKSGCFSCHVDVHRGEFGSDCSNCHDSERWGNARKNFDHDKARFKLTGLHRKVECNLCHKPEIDKASGTKFVIFKVENFSSCANCHEDFHKGRFGECEKCHSTSGWNVLKVKFNHDLTEFKLSGKHEGLDCEKCHKKSVFVRDLKSYEVKFKLKHSLCLDCHADYHKGVFSKRKSKGDCSDCHSEFGFVPTLFTVKRHAVETRFALKASHMTVPCVKCHTGETGEIFHWDEISCQVCHKDIHAGQFTGKKCENCHKETKWNDLRFDHNVTRFKLTGGHSNVKCSECHRVENSNGVVKYVGTPLECFNCHSDVHKGQFAESNRFVDCSRCHTADGWKNLVFDHNRDSSFKLEGAHKGVGCFSCHKTEIVDGVAVVRYKPVPTKCESCHGA